MRALGQNTCRSFVNQSALIVNVRGAGIPYPALATAHTILNEVRVWQARSVIGRPPAQAHGVGTPQAPTRAAPRPTLVAPARVIMAVPSDAKYSTIKETKNERGEVLSALLAPS